MKPTISSCPPKSRSFASWIILFSAVFSIAIVLAWAFQNRGLSVIAWIGTGYALLCSAFLLAQLLAFVRAHAEYDESIESPKFELLRIEDDT